MNSSSDLSGVRVHRFMLYLVDDSMLFFPLCCVSFYWRILITPWRTTRCWTKVTRRVTLVEQKLLTYPGNLISNRSFVDSCCSNFLFRVVDHCFSFDVRLWLPLCFFKLKKKTILIKFSGAMVLSVELEDTSQCKRWVIMWNDHTQLLGNSSPHCLSPLFSLKLSTIHIWIWL